ncbi:MAG TPA: LptA/OstA family protein, partial [Candidatus Acidoferrum sp.]
MAYIFVLKRRRQPRNRDVGVHAWAPAFFFFLAIAAATFPDICFAQQARLPFKTGGVAELSSSGPQSRRGDLYIADGDVDIRYAESHLRADHVEYNEKSSEAAASGHVQFDYENQHIEADEAHYNVKTGHGTFRNVRGTVKIERRPNPSVLLSENPLYFEAKEVERFSKDVYVIEQAW